MGAATDNDVIARTRDRISRARRVIELAHDPEMIAFLEQMIEEAESDIRRMEEATPAISLEIKPTV